MSDITIYTTTWCPYCNAAKQVLDRRGIGYSEIDIEAWDDPWAQLNTITGGSSVPQIVVGDRPIGGYDDLCALDRSGGLEDLTSRPN